MHRKLTAMSLDHSALQEAPCRAAPAAPPGELLSSDC